MGKEAVRLVDEIGPVLDQLPSGSALACLWLVENDEAGVILAMDGDVEAIAEHLTAWAEGKPEAWFRLHYLEKGAAYAGCLMPDLMKTSERWKIAFQLKYGYPPFKASESVLFRPLHFSAKSKVAFDRAKPFLRDRIRVGLVSSEGLTPETFAIEREKVCDRAVWLGRFKVVKETGKKSGLAHGYLVDQIDEMLKEG